MTINETYNIHKKLSCIFPFFKSKSLCKKEIHNYRINPIITVMPITYTQEDRTHTRNITEVIEYHRIYETNLKCICCEREEKLDEQS